MLSCALTFRGALYFNKAQIEGVNFGECQARTPENYKRICDHVSVKIIWNTPGPGKIYAAAIPPWWSSDKNNVIEIIVYAC